jgi:nicotinamidase-related amidase
MAIGGFVALEIDPGKTALVLIDLQAGILANTLAPYDSETVVVNGLTLARAVKAAGGTVVAVNVSFGPGRINGPQGLIDNPASTDPVPANYTEIVPELLALADIVITKRQWGALHGTELDTLLRRRGSTRSSSAGSPPISGSRRPCARAGRTAIR